MEKPKIFGCVNGGSPGWYNVCGIAEDGVMLASHLCSHPCFGSHDIGATSDWKHETYTKYYPNGFTVEWVEDVPNHEGLQRAFALNRAMTDEEHAAKLWMFKESKAADAVDPVPASSVEPSTREKSSSSGGVR